jgi:hypothetical protein
LLYRLCQSIMMAVEEGLEGVCRLSYFFAVILSTCQPTMNGFLDGERQPRRTYTIPRIVTLIRWYCLSFRGGGGVRACI